MTKRDLPSGIENIDKLEKFLLEGINSGPATEMTAKDWEDIRKEVEQIIEKRHGKNISEN